MSHHHRNQQQGSSGIGARRARQAVSQGQVVGRWTLKERIGGGGNGEVWHATDGQEAVAIKFLKKSGEKAIARFHAEISAMKQSADIPGILPVLGDAFDAVVAATSTHANSCPEWFAMPLAEIAPRALAEASVQEVVVATHAWARTLTALHARGVSHRDVKPDNLFRWNNAWAVGDFGLVRIPEMPRVTHTTERLGPWAILPPEMRRVARNADGKAADVYLLAKTLWILLTREKNGFDGPYVPDDRVLSLESRCGWDSFVHPLEELIAASTRNDPFQRPTMQQFVEVLDKWKSAASNFHLRATENWRRTVVSTFSTHLPSRAIWKNTEHILAVLKIAAKYGSANHLYFPSGGGSDLEDAVTSVEPECIELHAGGVSVVHPHRLILEVFDDHPEWNYFRLETSSLAPSGAYDDAVDVATQADRSNVAGASNQDAACSSRYEEVTELEPGYYVDASAWSDEHYGVDEDGEPRPLPAQARLISRYFAGDFVIFGKRSPYNQSAKTYDARHARMNADEFRAHVESAIDHLNQSRASASVAPIALPRLYPPPKGAPNRFFNIVCHLTELARKRRRELERNAEARQGEPPFQYLFHRDQQDQALMEYLNGLDDEDAKKVEVLMYVGRDGDPVEYLCRLLAGNSPAAARSQVHGKGPLDEYLENVLLRSRRGELDIERPLEWEGTRGNSAK